MTAEITPAPGQIWRETASGDCFTVQSLVTVMVPTAAVAIANGRTAIVHSRAAFIDAFEFMPAGGPALPGFPVEEHWETGPPEGTPI